MFFRHTKDSGLSHYAYLTSEGREVVAIYSRTDIEVYPGMPGRKQFELKHIFETDSNGWKFLKCPIELINEARSSKKNYNNQQLF